MTLTLTLPPEIEALLRQRAERTGQDVSNIALALLAFGLSFDEQDFFEALEGIQSGLNDFEQGRFCSFEEFIADQNQKHGLSLEAFLAKKYDSFSTEKKGQSIALSSQY